MSVTQYEWATVLPNLDILDNPCDILVPAALENQLTSDNAHLIQARIILELANWPTTPQAQQILKNNSVTVIPDILANAWGVTVSYFEQVQNNMNYYRSEQEVFDKLKTIMHTATTTIYTISRDQSTTLRDSAYIHSVQSILEAMKVRWR